MTSKDIRTDSARGARGAASKDGETGGDRDMADLDMRLQAAARSETATDLSSNLSRDLSSDHGSDGHLAFLARLHSIPDQYPQQPNPRQPSLSARWTATWQAIVAYLSGLMAVLAAGLTIGITTAQADDSDAEALEYLFDDTPAIFGLPTISGLDGENTPWEGAP